MNGEQTGLHPQQLSLPVPQTLPAKSISSRSKYDKERKLGHRRVGDGGEITYKKIQSTHIMGSIQLGIQHTVIIHFLYIIIFIFFVSSKSN